MSDWEQDSDFGAAAVAPPKPAVPAFGRRKFDDEDVEDEIKDDWEEEDDEPTPQPAAPVAPPKKKMSVKQKIAEKEAEEKRRAELGLDDEEDEEDEDDPNERRKREKAAQLKADIDNAAALLGTAAVADDALASLKSAKPVSKEDWESFATSLYAELIKRQASRPGFDKHFVPAMSKALSESLRDVDMRKMSTTWRELADNKVKADKEAKKLGGRKPAAAVGKAKPKSVGTASAKDAYSIDTTPYGDEALDDDDFM